MDLYHTGPWFTSMAKIKVGYVQPKHFFAKVHKFTKTFSYNNYRNFFCILLLISMLITISLPFINFSGDVSKGYERVKLDNLDKVLEVILPSDVANVRPTNTKCNHWNCFNIYRCGYSGNNKLSIYVYPLRKYVDNNGVSASKNLISKQFYTILSTIIESKYYTPNPKDACLFIPSIDTLNQENINSNITSRALWSLPFWSNGENHLIFNFISEIAPDYAPFRLNLGNAMVGGADFDTYSFRRKHDVAIPAFSLVAYLAEPNDSHVHRTWFVTSSQLSVDPMYLDQMQKIKYKNQDDVLVLQACHPNKYTSRCDLMMRKKYHYPQILQKSTFCLIFRDKRMGQFLLHEAMAANCIPVILIDGYVMPFNDIIDWKRIAIFIMESHLHTLMDVLNNISNKRIIQMRKSLLYVYHNYFSTMEKVTLTTLDILQERIYPHMARTYDDVNLTPAELNLNPLFYPSTAPKVLGFTAVILTYDRVASLFSLIERLSKIPSLVKIVVVWNHQKKSPPLITEFPKTSKPINVIRTKANKLSNRFYPYQEIETEAILHIDDDIVMLTSDEIEFAFEVWRELPDRIVGFPSRTHLWNNVTMAWKYESEWLNEISMVLTGAAFLHKYWSYLYTTSLPPKVKDWVDENMNCEDIAMNFLVANVTNKPPIKVTPRKKFKCPKCTNTEMLSADLGHMVARSQCIDKFAKAFDRMPLKSVEFRADPVLFKDAFPEKLKRFNNIGSL